MEDFATIKQGNGIAALNSRDGPPQVLKPRVLEPVEIRSPSD